MKESDSVKFSPTWRRKPIAGYAVLVVALAAIGLGYAVFSPFDDKARAASAQSSEQTLAKGEQLFNASCASCHGIEAKGTQRAPSLIGAGAASVDFQMSTGRMPLSNPYGSQAEQKNTNFSHQEIQAIAAYVGSLGPGPAIPTDEQVAYKNGDLKVGGKLFRANCATCHNFAGSGGALTYGKEAPAIDANARQMYEAMETGPGAMPEFDESVTPEQKKAIIHYVKFTQQEPNMGGFGLGRWGPTTEGVVGWVVGLGLIIACSMWITARKHG